MNGRQNNGGKGIKNNLACFAGLEEKQLGALYRLAPIHSLQEGEYLIREGDPDQTAYAILEGGLKVFKGGEDNRLEIASLGPGEWVGEIAFTRAIPRTASAAALAPTRVMAFNKIVLAALDQRTQLHIYRQLNDLSARRAADLAAREEELSARNQALVNYIAGRNKNRTDYAESEMIRGLLRKIPRLPDFALGMIVRVTSENAMPAEIGEIIFNHPEAADLVLEAVNSSDFGFKNNIPDIHQAMAVLGFHGVFQLALSEAVKKTLPHSPALRPLLDEAAALGHLAFALSGISYLGRPAEAAALGLLHHLGQCVIELLKEKNPNLTALIEALDPARLGALLMREWGMPQPLCLAVENQFKPEFAPPNLIPREVRDNVALLYFSHLVLAHFQGVPEQALPTAFLGDYLRIFGWTGLTVKELAETRLLPVLKKKFGHYPLFLRELLAGVH
ncbi:MAG: HDOD domain-containing protein [Pseudomonadota bacterium]